MTILIDNFQIKPHKIKNIPRNKELNYYAKRNRHKGNIAEVVFWKHVNKKQFYGIDFNRQYVIGNYFADFYARSLCLVVEIDGSSHNEKMNYDSERDLYMQSLGLKVFRTTDYDVINNLDIVLKELKEFIIKNYEHETEEFINDNTTFYQEAPKENGDS